MNGLSLPVQSARSFALFRAGWLWTLLHQFAVVGKIYTGDSAFDEEFFIRSAETKWAREFFADAECRRLARALFSLGCARVELSGGSLQASFKTGGGLEEARPALSDLAAKLPRG